MHYILSVQSDPMIVTFCLAGIDMYLSGHYRWALVFGVLGSLGRPEVWPFLGCHMVWAWLKMPSMRWLVAGAVALIAFMWFGIPWITNGRPNIAGELALRSPRELHENKVFGTIGRFTELQYLPLWIAGSRHGRHRPRAPPVARAGLGRRDRGVSANRDRVRVPRLPGALALHVRAGRRGRGARGNRGRVDAGRPPGTGATAPRRGRGVPRWARVAAVALLVVALVPGAAGRCEPSAPTCGYKGAGRTRSGCCGRRYIGSAATRRSAPAGSRSPSSSSRACWLGTPVSTSAPSRTYPASRSEGESDRPAANRAGRLEGATVAHPPAGTGPVLGPPCRLRADQAESRRCAHPRPGRRYPSLSAETQLSAPRPSRGAPATRGMLLEKEEAPPSLAGLRERPDVGSG